MALSSSSLHGFPIFSSSAIPYTSLRPVLLIVGLLSLITFRTHFDVGFEKSLTSRYSSADYSIQRSRFPCLTLPNNDHLPSERSELFLDEFIATDVSCKFGGPVWR